MVVGGWLHGPSAVVCMCVCVRVCIFGCGMHVCVCVCVRVYVHVHIYATSAVKTDRKRIIVVPDGWIEQPVL